MAPIHFHWSMASLKLSLFLAGGLSLLGLPMLLADDGLVHAIGIFWIVGMLWLCQSLARRMRDVTPVVTVDGAGMIDRRIFNQPLTWDEIESIDCLDAESMTWIGLSFVDPRRSLVKATRLVRFFAPFQHVLGLPRVSISMVLLDSTPAELMAAVRAHQPGKVAAARASAASSG
ncbi:MAG: hypothetical protein ACT4N2_05140 [Hyphomicrobium sp.]